MTRNARPALAGLTLLALAGWLLMGAVPRTAADDKDKEKEKEKAQQEQRQTVDKLADAVSKGDKDEIKKQADAIAKASDLDDVMGTLGTKKEGGFGFPAKAPKDPPDGIELKLKALNEKAATAKEVQADADAFARMAVQIAAVSEVARIHPLKKAEKDPNWVKWTDEMRGGADDLAKAAAAKDDKAVDKAVKRAYKACTDCHAKYKD
jgi:hypothetical protein